MNAEIGPEKGAGRPATLNHLPALDGLRGIAVIGVLLFHDSRLKGGYLGVDLFFVLSGFLITSLLLAEYKNRGHIDLYNFWERRARRLLPAVLLLLLIVSTYSAVFAKPTELSRIRADGIATLFYFANWRSIFAGKSYWDLFRAASPFEHTWSLAIEEQFYVLWPLASVLTLTLANRSKKSPRKDGAAALFGVAAILMIASGVAMVLRFSPDFTSRAYWGTDTRGGAILSGAALACFLSMRPLRNLGGGLRTVRVFDGMGLIAMVGLGLGWATLEGRSPFLYHGGFWLTEACVLILIICAWFDQKSLVAKVFSIKPLRYVGLISYGVYLFHWPVFLVLTPQRTGLSTAVLSVARLLGTLLLSLASYYCVEQPIRKKGLPFGRPYWVIPVATALSMGALLWVTRGADASYSERIFPAAYNEKIRELPRKDQVAEGSLRVLVVGDSVAVALGDRLRFVQESKNAKVAVRALGDCNILDEQFTTKSLNNRKHEGGDCDRDWQIDVLLLKPDVVLIVLGGAFFAPVQVGDDWKNSCDPEWNQAIRKELLRTVTILTKTGTRVVLGSVPYPVGPWADERWNRGTDCFNAALLETAAAVPGASVLSLKEELCPGKDHTSCILLSQGAPIRPDGMHFDGLGGEEIARWTLHKLSD